MPTCPNGHLVDPSAKYCPECGIELSPPPEPRDALVDHEDAETPVAMLMPRAKRHRLRNILLLAGAVVAIGAFLNEALAPKGGTHSDRSTISPTHQQAPPRPKHPKPTRYGQILKPGATVRATQLAACVPFNKVIGRWDEIAQERSAAIRGVTADPYTAAAFVSRSDTGWLRDRTRRTFVSSVHEISRQLLLSAAGPRRQLVTASMVVRYQDDALFRCHLGRQYTATRAALITLDMNTAGVIETAQAKPWYPKDWYPSGTNAAIAYHWDNDVTKCQDDYSFEGEYCFGMQVMSEAGCPNGLYAQINILNGSTVIDYSNDSVGSLEPKVTAELAFKAFENTTGYLTAHLTELNCY